MSLHGQNPSFASTEPNRSDQHAITVTETTQKENEGSYKLVNYTIELRSLSLSNLPKAKSYNQMKLV
jgi:hypothetical protein